MSETKTKEEEKEKTSIKIKPKTWQEAKIQAIRERMTVSEFVEQAIEKYIKEHGKK